MKSVVLNFVKSNPTVAITILTAYSYFCAYQYEMGFCSYFKIPNTYIDIGITDIIKFASALITGLYLVFFFYMIFLKRKEDFSTIQTFDTA